VTSELISLAHFERFSLPHMQIMVDEIHRVGHKAILVYYGGIADRLEQIAALGADGLLFECSMKAYVNDVAEFAERVGDRLTLFGNLDPIGVLQNGTDGQLEAEIRRQIAAGRRARGFIMSTASPITPFTPLARVQRFIEQSRRLGTAGAAR
jgi:uroporphyrinogen decarboxylase